MCLVFCIYIWNFKDIAGTSWGNVCRAKLGGSCICVLKKQILKHLMIDFPLTWMDKTLIFYFFFFFYIISLTTQLLLTKISCSKIRDV